MYRTIDAATWSDPWFEELDPLAKLLFLYLITTGKQTNCGVFTVTQRTISYETGLSTDQIRRCMKLLVEGGRVTWWSKESTVWVHNFYRHQRVKSSWKYTVSARAALSAFPPHIREAVQRMYPDLSLDPTRQPKQKEANSRLNEGYPTDRVSIPYQYPTDTLSEIGDTLSIPYRYPTDTLPTEHNRTEQSINITDTQSFNTKILDSVENDSDKESVSESINSSDSNLDIDWESISPYVVSNPHHKEDIDIGRGERDGNGSIKRAEKPHKGRAGVGVDRYPIPPDWSLSDEMRLRCGAEGITPQVDLDELAKHFVGYYTEGEGEGAQFHNWDFKFLEWARREKNKPTLRKGKAQNERTDKAREEKKIEGWQEMASSTYTPPKTHPCLFPGCSLTTARKYCQKHGVFPAFEQLKEEWKVAEQIAIDEEKKKK